MKTVVISNGTHKLAIIPENDLEKMLLQQIFATGAHIDITQQEKAPILDKNYADAVIIMPSEGAKQP